MNVNKKLASNPYRMGFSACIVQAEATSGFEYKVQGRQDKSGKE